jgi:hypothetical protein
MTLKADRERSMRLILASCPRRYLPCDNPEFTSAERLPMTVAGRCNDDGCSDRSFGPAFNCLSGESDYGFALCIKQDQLITVILGASCDDKLGAWTGLFEANYECLVRHHRPL